MSVKACFQCKQPCSSLAQLFALCVLRCSYLFSFLLFPMQHQQWIDLGRHLKQGEAVEYLKASWLNVPGQDFCCFDIILFGTDMQTWIAFVLSFIVSSEMGISSFLCIFFPLLLESLQYLVMASRSFTNYAAFLTKE